MAGRLSLLHIDCLRSVEADQIPVFEHGEIVEHGSHEELMRTYGPYYQLVDAQYQFLA